MPLQRQMLKESGQEHVSPRYEVFKAMEDIRDHIYSVDYDVAVKPAGVTEGDGVKVVGILLNDMTGAVDYATGIFEKI